MTEKPLPEMKPLPEIEQALNIANRWLDGRMIPLMAMVPGDPDCDACIVARQLIRQRESFLNGVAAGERAVKGWHNANQQLSEMKEFLDLVMKQHSDFVAKMDSYTKIRSVPKV